MASERDKKKPKSKEDEAASHDEVPLELGPDAIEAEAWDAEPLEAELLDAELAEHEETLELPPAELSAEALAEEEIIDLDAILSGPESSGAPGEDWAALADKMPSLPAGSDILHDSSPESTPLEHAAPPDPVAVHSDDEGVIDLFAAPTGVPGSESNLGSPAPFAGPTTLRPMAPHTVLAGREPPAQLPPDDGSGVDLLALSTEAKDVVVPELGGAPAEAPSSGDSGIDLVEEQMLAEGDSSSFLSGINHPGQDKTDSGRDLIAEAVESGIDLDVPEMEIVAEAMPSSSQNFGHNELAPFHADEIPSSTVNLGGPSTRPQPGEEPGPLSSEKFDDANVEADINFEEISEAHQAHSGVTASEVDLGGRPVESRTGAANSSLRESGEVVSDSDENFSAMADSGRVAATVNANPDSMVRVVNQPEPEEELDLDAIGLSEEEEAVAEDEERDRKDSHDELAAAGPAPSRRGAWLGGTLLGTLVGTGACIALGFAGINLPEMVTGSTPSKQTTQKLPAPTETAPGTGATGAQPAAQAPAGVSAEELLKTGEFVRAAQAGIDKVDQGKRSGEHRWLAYLNKQALAKAAVKQDDAEVKQAVEELTKTETADAAFWLGHLQEMTGDVAAARKTYTDAAAKYKDDALQARRFQAALDRLELRADKPAPAGGRSDARPWRADEALVAALLLANLQADQPKDDEAAKNKGDEKAKKNDEKPQKDENPKGDDKPKDEDKAKKDDEKVKKKDDDPKDDDKPKDEDKAKAKKKDDNPKDDDKPKDEDKAKKDDDKAKAKKKDDNPKDDDKPKDEDKPKKDDDKAKAKKKDDNPKDDDKPKDEDKPKKDDDKAKAKKKDDNPKDDDKPKKDDKPQEDKPLPPLAGDAEEAGFEFWTAAKRARDQQYAQALQSLARARAIHEQRRLTQLRKPQNPLSDPTEEIFLRACDELKTAWELKEQLNKEGYLADNKEPVKALTDLLAKVKDAGEGTKAFADRLVNEKIIEKPEEFADGFDKLLKARKAALALGEKLVKENAAEKPEDLDKAVTELLSGKKAVESLADKLVKAKVIEKTEDFAKGVDALLSSKQSEDELAEKLVKEKVVDNADLAKGVDALLADRKAAAAKVAELTQSVANSTATLKQVSDDLVAAKLLDDKGNLVQSVKNAVKLAAQADPQGTMRTLQSEVDKARAVLAVARTPRDMLNIWLPQMKVGSQAAIPAARDADRVLADTAASPQQKLQAQALNALSMWSQGKFDDARAALEKIQAALPTADGAWRTKVEEALKDTADPARSLLEQAQSAEAKGNLNLAIDVVTKALNAGEGNGRTRTALLLYRAKLLLDQARAANDGRLAAGDANVKAARTDFGDAAKMGSAQAHYSLGRLAEELGRWSEAESAYRAALKAHPAVAGPGSTYRVSLARVLLRDRQGLRASPSPAPRDAETPEPTPKPEAKDKDDAKDAPKPAPKDKDDAKDAPKPAPKDKDDAKDAPKPAPKDKDDAKDAPKPAPKDDAKDAPKPAPKDKDDSKDAPKPAPKDKDDAKDAPKPAPKDKDDTKDAPKPAPKDDAKDAPKPAPKDKDDTKDAPKPAPNDKDDAKDAPKPAPKDKGDAKNKDTSLLSPSTKPGSVQAMMIWATLGFQERQQSLTPAQQEALQLADEILAAPADQVPFDARAKAMAIKGLWSRALQTYADGLRSHLPRDLADGLLDLVRGHPSMRRPENLGEPNSLAAERHYANGLRHYFARKYAAAERDFTTAIAQDNQDARLFYFLGLARIAQNKRDGYEDFEQAAKLEQQERPGRTAVSQALERVQGRPRRELNQVRDSAQ